MTALEKRAPEMSQSNSGCLGDPGCRQPGMAIDSKCAKELPSEREQRWGTGEGSEATAAWAARSHLQPDPHLPSPTCS